MEEIYQSVSCNYGSPHVAVPVIDIFDKGYGHLSTFALSGQLRNHLFQYLNHLIIATDASVIDAVAGSGISISQLGLQYAVGLPYFTTTYDAELISTLVALSKEPSSFPTVFVLSGSLSVIMALKNSLMIRCVPFYYL